MPYGRGRVFRLDRVAAAEDGGSLDGVLELAPARPASTSTAFIASLSATTSAAQRSPTSRRSISFSRRRPVSSSGSTTNENEGKRS
ncbi:MAG: hypothetical protein GY719_17215 [bacterium]|nr:hypothetical protein [bacterium]